MTQKAQQILEQRFLKLREVYSEQQWISIEFLSNEVTKLEKTDITLAYRLMQRIKNLSPSQQHQRRLAQLQKMAFKDTPELAVSTSSEPSNIHNDTLQNQTLFSKIKDMLGEVKHHSLRKPLITFIVIPFLIFAFYQVLVASPRYESQAQIIVKEPNGMATLDPAMAVVSGFGISGASSDTELVKAFIHSNDMLAYLEEKLGVSQHFSDSQYDIFSRLSSNASGEDQLEYFLSRVVVEIDEKSQVITVYVQAFEQGMAHELSQTIVARAEWYINEIGRNLAKAQLDFVQQEHRLVQEKLREAKSVLLDFQRRFDLLDPEAEGAALQQITYQLEGLIATKRAELRALRSSMSEGAPLIMQGKAELDSLTQQLDNERNRLTEKTEDIGANSSEKQSLSVGEILAKYSDYKINLELALQGYTSSLVSLEKSRIEAYRQLKYLVVVESPTLPEDASYPKVLYNLALFLVVTLMLFGIGKVILATVEELK